MTTQIAILSLFLLTVCDRSASYYSQHQQERAEVLTTCTAGHTRGRDCDNAAAAAAEQRHRDAEKAFRSGLDKT